MKKIILTFSLAFIGLTAYSAKTIGNETASFTVSGNAICETSIENIITSLEGVVSANWDPTTKVITIVFDAATIKKDIFYVALAEAGYDNQELHAKQFNYDKLPDACKYTRQKEND